MAKFLWSFGIIRGKRCIFFNSVFSNNFERSSIILIYSKILAFYCSVNYYCSGSSYYVFMVIVFLGETQFILELYTFFNDL
jgi:hypothetical protein